MSPSTHRIRKIQSKLVFLPVLIIILSLIIFSLGLGLWVDYYHITNPFQIRFPITIFSSFFAVIGMVYAIISECASQRLYIWFLLLGVDLAIFFIFLGLAIVWGVQASSAHNQLACTPTTQSTDPILWTRLEELYNETKISQGVVCTLCGLICIMSLTRTASFFSGLCLKKALGLKKPEDSGSREKNGQETTCTTAPEITITLVDRDIAHHNPIHPYHPLRLNPAQVASSIREVEPEDFVENAEATKAGPADATETIVLSNATEVIDAVKAMNALEEIQAMENNMAKEAKAMQDIESMEESIAKKTWEEFQAIDVDEAAKEREQAIKMARRNFEISGPEDVMRLRILEARGMI